MTTYNTGNPIGSTDPRDLYDNAQNMDNLENGTAPEYQDRLGRSRKSREGMSDEFNADQSQRESEFDGSQSQRESEFNADQSQRESEFDQFIASSGYEVIGDYAAGIAVTGHNQVIRDAGIGYRPSISTDLPYTTTGAGMPEGGAFVSVGDAVLRQELAGSASGSGAALVSMEGGPNVETAVLNRVLLRKTFTILCTGQSNMGGSSNILQGNTDTDENVLAWNARYNENGTFFKLATLGETPFSSSGTQHIGFNAGKYLSETYGHSVNLINMAKGGTPIERWLDDDANPEMWLAIDRESSAAFAFNNKKIDLVFWMQGEDNSGSNILDYKAKFEQFKNQVIAAPWSSKDVKFILGGLASGLSSTGSAGARNQMNLAFTLIEEENPDCQTVFTGDLLSDSTGIHFLDSSIIQIGKRFGETALSGRSVKIGTSRIVSLKTNITYETGIGKFRDFNSLIDFISTLQFKPQARLVVSLPAGDYEIDPLRLGFSGSYIEFIGDLSAGFSKPIKTDFTGVQSTDLAMLEEKYLTRLNVTSGNAMFILGGGGAFAGVWTDLLLKMTTPGASAAFVRSADPNLPTAFAGSITFDNVAMHGAQNSSSCFALDISKAATFSGNNCTVSHCDNGLISNKSSIYFHNGLIAHTPNAVHAISTGFVLAVNLDIESPSGTSYKATLGGYIDNRNGDDIGNEVRASNGFIVVP